MKKLNLNLLSQNNIEQLLQFSEIIILLTAISSRVDEFTEKIKDADEKLLSFYFGIIDKYLILNNLESSILDSNTSFIRRNSEEFMKKSLVRRYAQSNKKIDDLLKEKTSLNQLIADLTQEKSTLKEQLSDYDKKYSDLESTFKDKLRELEFTKSLSKEEYDSREELLHNAIMIGQLKTQINQKEIEIENLRKDHELSNKLNKEEIFHLNSKLENYEEKFNSIKSVCLENEKLKAKIKELSVLKDKEIELNQLMLNLDSKDRMIETLMKDKQNYLNLLEKGNSELLNEKEKLRKVEYEKKKIESDLNELKKEILKNENLQIRGREIQSLNVSLVEITKEGNRLIDLDKSQSFFKDMDKTHREDKTKFLESEIEDIKRENQEINKELGLLIEENQHLTTEKEKLLSQLDRIDLENRKIFNEKEKLSLDIGKIELRSQSAELNFLKEKNKLEDELKDTQEKMKKILNEKTNLTKELDILKKEKETNMCEKFNFQKENEKLKQYYEKESKHILDKNFSSFNFKK